MYLHVYTHIYIYVCIPMYMYIYVNTRVNICPYAYTRILPQVARISMHCVYVVSIYTLPPEI